jgi:hypothetical protein
MLQPVNEPVTTSRLRTPSKAVASELVGAALFAGMTVVAFAQDGTFPKKELESRLGERTTICGVVVQSSYNPPADSRLRLQLMRNTLNDKTDLQLEVPGERHRPRIAL